MLLHYRLNIMIAAQQDIPPPELPAQLRDLVEAIGERPADTAAEGAARSQGVVDAVLGFQPRDPLEIMFAGLAVTHAHLVHDSARDVMRGQEDVLKARTKSTIVALDRGMLGFLKELRIARTRTLSASVVLDARPGSDDEACRPGADESPLAAPVIAAANPRHPPANPTPSHAVTARPSTPIPATAPEPPVPLLPPLRRAETSIAAMLAVVSPTATPRFVATRPVPRAAAPPTPPASASVTSWATSATTSRTGPALPVGGETAATFEAAGERFAASAG